MKVYEQLSRLEDLLADPNRWTQGWLALDDAGKTADPISPYAVRWCLEGGCQRVLLRRTAYHALMAAVRETFPNAPRRCAIVYVNDELGHDAVMAVIRRAKKMAREREGVGA